MGVLFWSLKSMCIEFGLSWSSASKDGKQVDEEIDDIDVEDDGSNDVVVDA